MRIITLPFLLIFLLGSLCSCSTDTRRLGEIDSIIETDPAAALVELQSLRPDAYSPADYAYYCLLLTQAQIKCNIAVDSDSLIRTARDFYVGDNTDMQACRALFYSAQIAYNHGDLRKAMADVVEAYEMANDNDDHLWIARTAELTADIFWEVYNFTQAELYTREAAEQYRLAGRTAGHRYALADLGTALQHQGDYEGAILLLDSLFNVISTEAPLDSATYSYIMGAYNSINYNYNLPDSREKPQIKSPTPGSAEEFVDRVIFDSYSLSSRGDFQQAKTLLDEAYRNVDTDKQRIRILYAAFKLHTAAGEHRQAAELTDSILRMHARVLDESIRETVTSVQKDFYSSRARIHKRKSEQFLFALIAVVIVALLIFGLLYLLHRSRSAARKAELEANLASLLQYRELVRQADEEKSRITGELAEKSRTIEDLRHQLDQMQPTDDNSSEIIEHLFREKWATLNMLCNEYFEMGDSPNMRGVILNNIEKELHKLKSRKNIADIEKAVNTYMGNIMDLLRQECTFLKEEDFVFLLLVFAGLSVRAVCLFTNIKYKLFYLKKSRLTKRIAQSGAPHTEFFLQKLR